MYICNEDGEIQYANKKFKEHYCINSEQDQSIIKSSFIKENYSLTNNEEVLKKFIYDLLTIYL